MTRVKLPYLICQELQELMNFFLVNQTLSLSVKMVLSLKIDWNTGQKTGFFIDQRENRKLLGNFTSGRNVLNLFGYTGGFSVYAMKDASLVHTVDSSASAIELADENIKLNFGNDPRHKSFQVDAFEFLNDISGKYDLIILDPPAFAKHNNVLANALQGYKRLNMKAIETDKTGWNHFYLFLFTGCYQGKFQKIGFCSSSQYRQKSKDNSSAESAT